MSVITSVNGDVHALIFGGGGVLQMRKLREVTKWSFTAKVNTHEYASNFTGGIKRKLRGCKSASGNINGVFDPIVPIFRQINEDTDCGLYLSFTTNYYIYVDAMIDQMGDLTVDIDNGGIETWQVNWSAIRGWIYPTGLSNLVANMQSGYMSERDLLAAADEMEAEDEEEIDNIESVVRGLANLEKRAPGFTRAAKMKPLAQMQTT
jgi:hypothetical protein